MTFQEKLDKAVTVNKSLLCIGLDADFAKLPLHLKNLPDPQFRFNKQIVDKTADLVCAYKPNSAFYERRGIDGMRELEMTCTYIKKTYPHIPLILDAKRADIGNTNNGYVQYAFEYLQADAVTLHPYLGGQALGPFLDRKDKGVIILCRTSNPGAGELQDLLIDNKPLYLHIATKAAKDWNGNGNVMLVVGATYPEELSKVRSIAGDMVFLVPGIGAQGGDLERTVKLGKNSKGRGLIISASRSILFASPNEDFALRAREAAGTLRDEINTYL